MACCKESTPDDEANKKINEQIRRDKLSISKLTNVKLLLLGTGDSGKSTIAKQLRILFLNGFPDDERKNHAPSVRASVITNLKDVLKTIQKFNLELPTDIQDISNYITALRTSEVWTIELLSKIKTLLRDHTVAKIIRKSNRKQIYDHFDYMLAKLDVIASHEYVPTVEDILKVRVCTTGIVEITFPIDGINFAVMDMGGQRSERRKWIHFFELMYDLQLREDPNVNRMHESLDLFKKVVNNELKDLPVILFLNKSDLFQEKIVHSELRSCFPEYTGPNEFQPAVDFIGQKFVSYNLNANRRIFTHTTCATDTDNINRVFNDVRITIIDHISRVIV